MSCEVEGCWSAGISYHFISEDGYNYDFLRPFMFEEPYELQLDVWGLSQSKDIESFKKKYHIIEIKELHLGPCGVGIFRIENDEFVELNKTRLESDMSMYMLELAESRDVE